jgi:hypothetical protein
MYRPLVGAPEWVFCLIEASIGLPFVAIGLYIALGGAWNWEGFMLRPQVRVVLWLLGQRGERVFYALVGAAIIAFGTFFGLFRQLHRQSEGAVLGCKGEWPSRHKALKVKRKCFPKPRGTAFFLTPFLRGHSGGGAGPNRGDPTCDRQQTRRRAPMAKDEPHPTVMRTPAAPPRKARRRGRERSPGRSRSSFVPRPVASQGAAGSLPRREGPVRHGSRRGPVVRRFLLLRGGGPAGVGRTWDGASAPSPYARRPRRADLASSPQPTAGPRPGRWTTAVHREVGRGRRPIKAAGCRGDDRGHPVRTRGPRTARGHRGGWPHRLPFGFGSPAAPWLNAP